MIEPSLERYLTRAVARMWCARAFSGLPVETLIKKYKVLEDIHMEYAHEKAEAALNALTTTASDADIVQAITNYLMVGKHAPYVFKINHNAQAAPCPVIVHKVHGAKHCSVALRDPDFAHNWCVGALLRGYEVSCGTKRDEEVRSLARERDSIRHRVSMAEYHAKRAAAKSRGEPDPDDGIPF